MKRYAKFLFGALLFAFLMYSLVMQVKGQENFAAAKDSLLNHWTAQKALSLVAVFVLMYLNWALESLKWKKLLAFTEELSFRQSFQSVLTGLAVSVVTPNRIGEYLGRILYLKNTNKLKGISITIIGSFAQILVTSLFGVAGLLYFLINVSSSASIYILFILSILISLGMAWLLFNLDALVNFCGRYSFLKKLKIYIEVIKRYDRKLLLQIIAYSASRYLIYSFQLYLLLCVTHGSVLPFTTIAGVYVLFWVLAVVPSFAIADVGIRGQAATWILAFVSQNVLAIITATALLWFINLILPALIGCFFVFKIKLFNED